MKLACKDLSPNTTCTFEVEAPTAMGAAKKMLSHARVKHAADIQGMPDADVLKVFESKVRA